ncbi:MAG: HPr family phosphocarrier protein [Oscillospiraceae bacterium]|nr:HPr family phosphocarrier protein [Oscillospiraceae bacterium]
MKSFEYTIKDSLGIHARPAGLLAKTVKALDSEITIKKDGKEVNASKLMAVMGMGIKCGDTVTVTAEGGDEEKSVKLIEEFFEANL